MKILHILFILLVVVPLTLEAQPLDPHSPTPIDGGLSLLLASGAALGVAKYRQHKKESMD